ncbi:MAG: hypothetical protein WAX69_22850 [Victivallales bacterium]
MDKFMLAAFVGAFIIPVLISKASAEPKESPASGMSGSFWDFTKVEWGDGRPFTSEPKRDQPWPKEGAPQGWNTTYNIDIPADGWYELFLKNPLGQMGHDLVIDGNFIYRSGELRSGDKGDFISKETAKTANLFLKKGKHEMNIRRVGRISFPHGIFDAWEFKSSEKRPEASVSASKTIIDVVRAGEKLKIKVLGGGTNSAASYKLLRANLLDPKAAPEATGVTVNFEPSAEPVEKTVEIQCPAEGVFELLAETNGKFLRPSEFRIGEFVVVDVNAALRPGGKPSLVRVIDCVANTIDGKPVVTGENYWECNGATRVSESKAGKYRESNNCYGADVEVPLTPTEIPRSYSGFAYRFDLPEAGVPYLIELEFPDDMRRSVTVPLIQIDRKTGGFVEGSSSYSKSYETGGIFPISNESRNMKSVFWAASDNIQICVISQQVGHRAAASKINIYRFDGELPATKVEWKNGRSAIHWYEEALSWRFLTNIHLTHRGAPQSVRAFIGLDRWARLVRYFGFNGITGLGVGYQEAFYRSQYLDGFLTSDFDETRLLALICEKYGMRYMPEVFPTQWYLNMVVLPKEVENPEDVRSVSCTGAMKGTGFAACDLNTFHPAIQTRWVNAMGELADKLRDSPAFEGICVRADAWLFRGDFNIPGLHWGYGDWTMKQFEKETGVKVPVSNDDPDRFVKRFDFLVSKDVKGKWMKWRSDKTMDYHLRIRDRIQDGRKDVNFIIAGDGDCDPCFKIPDGKKSRFYEMGIDLDRLKKTDGIAVMAVSRYGSRNTTSSEQAIYDGFFDPDNVASGFGKVRSFAAYMTYHELATYWPCDKLGVKGVKKGDMPYYCSAVLAAGRNSLEKFAVVLAEQDSAILRDGGNSDMFGDPGLWNEWFSEFESIPAVPFESVESARDPVAVWHSGKSDQLPVDGGQQNTNNQSLITNNYFFYAVNRERFPVEVKITLTGADSVTSTVNGKKTSLEKGCLNLTLQPYALRSFKTGKDAKIAEAKATVPEENMKALHERLAFSQQIAESITCGIRRNDVSEKLRAAYLKNLEQAWEAYRLGHVWRSRTALSMAPMMLVYEKISAMPEGQVITKFPGLLSPRKGDHWETDEGVTAAAGLMKMAAGTVPEKVPSTTYNAEWDGHEVLKSKNGTIEFDLDIPADGDYIFHLGHVAEGMGVTTASINGVSLAAPCITIQPGMPETAAFPRVSLKKGKNRLAIRRDGSFGVYGLKILPVLNPMPDMAWSTVGPFASYWGLHMAGRGPEGRFVKKGMDQKYPPEGKIDLSATYKDADGSERRWSTSSSSIVGKIGDLGVDMPVRTKSSSADFNYAVTFINSNEDRTALFYMGVDWWAKAFLNGEPITTNVKPEVKADCGSDFTTWSAVHWGVLKLKKGVNTLLVKQQGGSGGSAFSAYITDEKGITLSPKP